MKKRNYNVQQEISPKAFPLIKIIWAKIFEGVF